MFEELYRRYADVTCWTRNTSDNGATDHTVQASAAYVPTDSIRRDAAERLLSPKAEEKGREALHEIRDGCVRLRSDAGSAVFSFCRDVPHRSASAETPAAAAIGSSGKWAGT